MNRTEGTTIEKTRVGVRRLCVLMCFHMKRKNRFKKDKTNKSALTLNSHLKFCFPHNLCIYWNPPHSCSVDNPVWLVCFCEKKSTWVHSCLYEPAIICIDMSAPRRAVNRRPSRTPMITEGTSRHLLPVLPLSCNCSECACGAQRPQSPSTTSVLKKHTSMCCLYLAPPSS